VVRVSAPSRRRSSPLLSFLIRGASVVATRDPLSLAILEQIVSGGPRMTMVGDDALGLNSDRPSVARNRLAEIGVPVDRPLLGFQAREADYVGIAREQFEETARSVDEFATEHGYVVIAVPINMQSHAPEAELLTNLAYGQRRHAAVARRESSGDVAAIAGTIKICGAVLTHSYHEALFALERPDPDAAICRHGITTASKRKRSRTGFGIPVPLVASPDIDKDAIATKLADDRSSSWSRGMTGADVDRWLDNALPGTGGADAMPSNGRPRYAIHARDHSAGAEVIPPLSPFALIRIEPRASPIGPRA